jgi:hypothetical protein
MCIFTDTAQYKQRAPEQEQIFINIWTIPIEVCCIIYGLRDSTILQHESEGNCECGKGGGDTYLTLCLDCDI